MNLTELKELAKDVIKGCSRSYVQAAKEFAKHIADEQEKRDLRDFEYDSIPQAIEDLEFCYAHFLDVFIVGNEYELGTAHTASWGRAPSLHECVEAQRRLCSPDCPNCTPAMRQRGKVPPRRPAAGPLRRRGA